MHTALHHRTCQPAIPAGLSQEFNIVERPAVGTRSLPCWLAVPRNPDPTAPPLVAVHGILRDALGQARQFAPHAAAAGRLVIAPLFDDSGHRGYQRLITGPRADIALLGLLDELRREGWFGPTAIDLFGYSGGAQFAHRFALFYPHRVRRLTLAAAGWYTFPDDAPYPYGLGAPRRNTTAWGPQIGNGLSGFLRLPIRVCVGELDNQPDEHLRRSAALERQQGADRLSRARNWVEALQRAAAARDLPADIRLHELVGCGHDFRTCMRHGGLGEIALSDRRLHAVPAAESNRV